MRAILILVFLGSLPVFAGNEILIGSRVVLQTDEFGKVSSAEEAMTMEDCQKLADEQSLISPRLKHIPQKLERSEIRFNKEELGQSIIVRELQWCLATEAEIAPEEVTADPL